MSQILRAPVSFLTAIASATYNGNLALYFAAASTYATSPLVQTTPPPTPLPIAVGAAAAAFINPGAQILTGLPTVVSSTPPINARAWRMVITPTQAIAVGLGLQRPIELGEFCECQVSDPKDLLAMGFTVYVPTGPNPIPQIYG